MNEKWQERTRLLAGEKTLERYANAHVLVVGLGGVGAYAAEQLCRAGIGEMTPHHATQGHVHALYAVAS